MTKWVEYLKDCSYLTYGICTWSFFYTAIDSVNVLTKVEYNIQGSEFYGSPGFILEKFISQLSHNNPLL